MAGDATPDRTELRPHLLGLRAVDKAHALAEVELGGLLRLDVLDLKERGVLVLVTKPPLKSHHHTLDVQSTQTQKRGIERHRQDKERDGEKQTTKKFSAYPVV